MIAVHAKAIALSRRHACEADIDLITETLTAHQPDRTVILGAGSGTMSTSWIEWRLSDQCTVLARLMSIDHAIESLRTERDAWLGFGIGNGIVYTQQKLGDSAALAWKMMTVDFLIVDADHSYEGVHRDLNAWMPGVSVGGAIMLHDYDARHAPEFYPGVKQAADELLVLPDWEPIDRAGWSALWRRNA